MKRLADKFFIFVILFVIISWIIIYLIDLRNIFGLRDIIFSVEPYYFFFPYLPFVFQHWGRGNGIAEILQLFCLGGAGLMAAFCAGKIYGQRLFKFWAIMSVAFVLMLLEDAGDIRHLIMSYVQAIFKEPDQAFWGTGVELLYFLVLAGIPTYALIKYYSDIKEFSKAKIYLLIGFVFYAIAQSLSFVGTAFEGLMDKNVYTLMGDKLYDIALSIGDSGLAERWSDSGFPISFYLMDGLIEESLELIGAGAFFAATLSFLIICLTSE